MATGCVAERLVDLPDELLARIFIQLSPVQLSWLERVCRRCRTVVVEHQLWREHCLRAHPAVGAAAASIDAYRIPKFSSGFVTDAGRQMGAEEAAGAAESADSGSTHVGGVAEAAVQRSAFFKHLHYRLTAPLARESLIAAALGASSTDNPQESVANVLRPASRTRDLMCYWSSRGSPTEHSSEALAFRLAHPLCLVSEVQLRPFRAFFQWGSPIYAPKAVRFRLGGLACFAPSGEPLPFADLAPAVQRDLREVPPAPPGLAAGAAVQAPAEQQPGAPPAAQQQAAVQQPGQQQAALPEQQAAGTQPQQPQQQQQPSAGPPWVWESPVYEVQSLDELQRFPIPPTLCVGGYLRIELLGKRQRQAADDQFYSCVCYARAVGAPIYSFQLEQGESVEQGGGWVLSYRTPDPLQAAGGLVAVSEGGRLAAPGGGGGEGAGEEDGSDMESLEGHSDQFSDSEEETDEEEEEWLLGGDAGAY
ncbi:hypothetical protein ABPG75_006985 [Micractinium tetrahymenae]